MDTRPDRRRGTPGRSATDGWVRARRRARRRRVETAGWLLVAVGAATVAVTRRPHHPAWAPAALAALVAAALLVAVLRRPPTDPDRWRRGAAGEVATAELLDGLPVRRWQVLHDRRLPGTRANVDHLVIGRRGVWVLDSKAFRAPVRAGWRGVRVGDRRLDTSSAAWEADVVAGLLDVDVEALVVVHTPDGSGGDLPRRGRRCDGVRVLPAPAVIHHLRRSRTGVRLGRAARAELAERASGVLPEA